MASLFVDGEKRLEFQPASQTLSRLLSEAGISLPHPCGGRGLCGKCAAKVRGALSPASAAELEVLAERAAEGFRLCCLARAEGDVFVTLPGSVAAERQMQVQESGVFYKKPVDGEPGLGFAADIGTTTVVCYLYRLSDGALLAQTSAANPQRSFGADVISRMQHALNGEGAALADAIRGCLGELFRRAADAAGVSLSDIRRAVISGNTAMLYFLAALPVNSIAFAPFLQDEWFGRDFSAAELALSDTLAADTPLFLARSIGAYVGGDITAAALSCLLQERPGRHLLLDIGTNGEMVLSDSGSMTCCSAAAGPALEGAGIRCGAAAAAGAVNRVDLCEDGSFRFETVGGAPAAGLCGTGVIDLVAALLDAGILDETGRLLADGHDYAACMETVDNLPAFRLPETDILFTSADARQVQMAKAAIAAGIQTLLANAALTPADLDTLFLAGGFGSFVRPERAARIGLLPAELVEKTVVLGNASGTGAAMMLLCGEQREAANRLAETAVCTDLATDFGFLNAYTDGMFFPPRG